MLIESERRIKTSLVLRPSGRLDTITAPQFERKIKQVVGDDITELILDFLDVTYISSMGLRVLLHIQKAMNKSGRKFSIRNMGESVQEVFKTTGFINFMVQEEKLVVIKKKEGDTITLSLIGCMDKDYVPTLKGELSLLQDMHKDMKNTLMVILDMENLSSLTNTGYRMLAAAITETDWPRRRLIIQNVSDDIYELFKGDVMERFLDRTNGTE
jgi:anti-anti-sigma factor